MSEEPGWDDVICAARSQVSSPVGEEVAILGLDQGVYYGLNPSGARIWELLQQPIRVRDIHAAVVREFEIDEETARRDLLDLLATLQDAELIEVQGGDARQVP